MKVHAQNQSQPSQPAAPHFAGKNATPQTAARVVHPMTPLQRGIGHQESNRALTQNAKALAADSDLSEVVRFHHDFSQIPVFSKTPVRIQTKLTVNTPGDIYEQEADRVAEQVMRMPESGATKSKLQPIPDKTLSVTDSGKIEAPPIVEEILHSPGQQLDSPTRSLMEQRLGYDFSRVRVHSDSRSGESARAVNALAYTVGHQMVFQAGAYQPHTPDGRRLLAHELTHVLQQSGATGLSGENSGKAVVSSAPAGLYRQIAESDPDWLRKFLSRKASMERPIDAISIMLAIRAQQARKNMLRPFSLTKGKTLDELKTGYSLPSNFSMYSRPDGARTDQPKNDPLGKEWSTHDSGAGAPIVNSTMDITSNPSLTQSGPRPVGRQDMNSGEGDSDSIFSFRIGKNFTAGLGKPVEEQGPQGIKPKDIDWKAQYGMPLQGAGSLQQRVKDAVKDESQGFVKWTITDPRSAGEQRQQERLKEWIEKTKTTDQMGLTNGSDAKEVKNLQKLLEELRRKGI